MGERPRIDHSLTPPIREAQKIGERKQDRFNEAVANELDREFAETHDVGGLYFTHAFPSKNLESIIDEGGLRTPAQLEKRGVDFATGSYATVRGEIFFSKDQFYTQYTQDKNQYNERIATQGGCGILVPRDEFHRLRRFWKNTEGSRNGMVREEYVHLSGDANKRPGEFAIISESNDSGDPSTDTARKLVEQLKEKKLKEAEEVYEKAIEEIKSEFNRVMAELPPIEGFPTDAESVLSDTERYKRNNDIPKEIQELNRVIENAQKKIRDLEPRISEGQAVIRTREAIASQKIRLLEPKGLSKLLERFGIGIAKRKEKIKTIEDIAARDRADLDALLGEQSQEQTASETATARINALELYKKMWVEFFKLIRHAKRDFDAAKEDAEYKNSSWGSRARELRERLRKRDETEDTEDKFRVGLARSIILVDSGQLENALKATEGKPDLRARILVYDVSEVKHEFDSRHTEMFPESENGYITPDGLNSAQKLLTRTEDGLAILKTAQRGLPMKEPFGIAGIKRLDQYLEEQKMARAA